VASLGVLLATPERRTTIETSHRAVATHFVEMPNVKNVRVLGTILAMDLVVPDSGYLSSIGMELRKYALDRGVLLRPLGDTVYLLPPYCTGPDDLAIAYDVIASFVESR